MRKAATAAGFGRLLDAWTPPDGAGEPVGCLATSFTFDSVFFEEECIGRFLRLETDPTTDGALYLLEREEKLAQLSCALALVDRHNCKGSRSLRWDLVPVHVPGGVLHAKVSLLHWENYLRIILASANLTEDGYRRNQEVYAVLDFHSGAASSVGCLRAVAGFMRELLAGKYARGHEHALGRAVGLLERLEHLTETWGLREAKGIRVFPVLVTPGPGRPSALEQLAAVWPAAVLPSRAVVVSPFFDRDQDGEDRPAQTLWSTLLRKRGHAGVHIRVPVEQVPGTQERLIRAPKALHRATPAGRQQVYTTFERVLVEENRPLHAKALWFQDDRWYLYMMGSSNFTSAGLGLGASNIEANLAFLVDKAREHKEARALKAAFLPGESLKDDSTLRWLPICPAGEDEPALTDLPLPLDFHSAEYRAGTEGAEVVLKLAEPPTGWVLYEELNGARWFGDDEWQQVNRPGEMHLSWPAKRPPSGFWVAWGGVDGRAWLPVTIDGSSSLPPPEELRDLPLEVLIEVLTSSRPLHRVEAFRRYLRQRDHGDSKTDNMEWLVDPHRRVDTSQFLLQRTRRVSWALSALRERLERPVLSTESLWWRLRGPVGVTALADALQRESRSDEETAFLIAELVIELHRVQPKAGDGYADPEVVRNAVREVMLHLRGLVPESQRRPGTALGDYVNQLFEATGS